MAKFDLKGARAVNCNYVEVTISPSFSFVLVEQRQVYCNNFIFH